MKLSVLMPVYNEEQTVALAVKRLLDTDMPCETELVVVDDGSRDGTRDVLAGLQEPRMVVHSHEVNAGKGAAIRTAATLATGDFIVPFDADLEYDPADLPALVSPVLAGEAEVVFGTRTFSSHTSYSYWYVLGNRGVTTVANVLFNAYLRDLETCYKLMPRDLYLDLDVRSRGFGMEAEIAGKLLRRGVRPYEVPVSYRARTREQGKKLTWRDGVEAVGLLARERFRR